MEIQYSEQTAKILEIINKGKDFKKLKSDNNDSNSFSVPLKVSGYNELNIIVAELLKASIILLNDDARSTSVIKEDVNVMMLLEVALQLLPEDEMVLMDDIHQLYLKSKP